jgi:hypothetical protein
MPEENGRLRGQITLAMDSKSGFGFYCLLLRSFLAAL